MTNLVENPEVAQVFEEVADLLELQGENPFRVRAYRNAARRLQDLREPVAAMKEEELLSLGGIGKDLAEKIRTIASGGDLPLARELRQKTPAGLRDLMKLPGLGPKKAHLIFERLGIHTLADLREAAAKHQIRELPGFGAKTEASLLEALAKRPQLGGKRISLAAARPYAERLVSYLKETPGLKQIDVAGSFRRRQETIGDLDILVVCRQPQQVMERLASFGGVADILARGDTKMSVRLRSGLQIDLRVVPEESYGAALQYFTGSKAHSIELRHRALARGLKVNEYGVFRGKKRIAGRTEGEVYKALDLPWIPPELREARGEIERAAKGQLPKLIELQDIRGDLHMHTTATDGRAALTEMVAAAKQRGYAYIAITDHSRRVTVAHGLDSRRLKQHWAAIDRLAQTNPGITILKGIELDILEDGRLDLPDSVLKEADWVLASLHYGLKQSRRQITRRVLNAIKNPYVSAIGHPTSRLIGERDAVALDFETIVKAAADHGCLLELDGQPSRLDLDDVSLMIAKEHGVPIVIDSDAHSTEELNFMEYGVFQARRGGLTAKDVANTRSLKAFRQLLRNQ